MAHTSFCRSKMHPAYKLFVFLSVTYLVSSCVECATIGKGSSKGDNKQEGSDRNRSKQQDEELAYKLENAPIPSIHGGPQVLRSRTVLLKDLDDFKDGRFKRDISQADALNPQKPRQKKDVIHQETSGANVPKPFHHPGHSFELSSNQPINTYNYYKVLNMYGSAFQYGNNQPFKGYTQTSNIGIIPPSGTNAKDYYNGISNLQNYPIIGRHSLYENQKYPSGRYGYNDENYVRNAYENVLTGLAMWSIMNGLVTGKRYTVYDHKTIPRDYTRNITLTNDTLAQCFEDASALCGSYSQPLCINNGTTFCVSSTVIPCQGHLPEKKCVNISEPCDKCEDTQRTCAAYVTVSKSALDKQIFNDTSYLPDVENIILCVTTLVVPQDKDANKILCDRLPCLENTTDQSNLLNSE